jgi:hypothetical protein
MVCGALPPAPYSPRLFTESDSGNFRCNQYATDSHQNNESKNHGSAGAGLS